MNESPAPPTASKPSSSAAPSRLRRRLCPALLACAGASLLYESSSARAPNPDASTPITVQAPSARLLADSLGIVTHLDYLNTPYGDFEKVKASLAFLGIHNLRDTMPRTNTVRYEALAGLHYHFDLVVRSEAANELPTTLARLESLEQHFPGAIASIEGLNEANHWPAVYRGLRGFPATIALQQDLYAAVKQSTTLRRVPVYAPTLGGAGTLDYQRLGDLSDYADLANAHIYFPKGSPPSQVWDAAVALNRLSTPRLPQTAITETGYTTARRSEHRVDEPTQAKYLLMLLAHAWSAGITHLYIYQLVDDSTDDADWTRGLGLYAFDWRAKPAATAMHHLLEALRAKQRPEAGHEAPSLSYTTSPVSADVRTLLLHTDGGGFDLLIWRDVPLWDNVNYLPRAYAPLHVSLTENFATLEAVMLEPLSGGRRVLRAKNARIEFDLTDEPLLLELSERSSSPSDPLR